MGGPPHRRIHKGLGGLGHEKFTGDGREGQAHRESHETRTPAPITADEGDDLTVRELAPARALVVLILLHGAKTPDRSHRRLAFLRAGAGDDCWPYEHESHRRMKAPKT